MLIQREKFLQKYKKIPVFRVEIGKDCLISFRYTHFAKLWAFVF
jgi:hypothetical protein